MRTEINGTSYACKMGNHSDTINEKTVEESKV